MEALSAEWKRSTRAGRAFALVLMDLDRFKFVNDFYGHLEGDLVLQRVGHILETNCRRSDVVARYGGDEFVILMPETNMEHARQLASKLRGWVSADPLLREKNISASFGIACYPLHGSSPQELIRWPTLRCIFQSIRAATRLHSGSLRPQRGKKVSATCSKRIWA